MSTTLYSIIFSLLFMMPQGAAHFTVRGESQRTISGIIYFTNNTPRDFDTFPVELFTRDQRKRLAGTTADSHGRFSLTGIKPGKYLLKFTWPDEQCTLWYKVDVRAQSNTRVEVIMDADCSKHNGKVLDLDAE